MKVKKIINNVNIKALKNVDETQEISNLTDNSLGCSKNSMFFCLNGTNVSGENYAKQAIENGATIIVTENELSLNIPQIIVEDTRVAISEMSSNFYSNAHKKLKVIGVVGTNGKTSSANIIYTMLNSLGENTGFIGTNLVMINGKNYNTNLTTPDPIELHKIFKKMVTNKVKYCVMEVSAHAIYFNKVKGINFETLLFTNISQDHLDFFKDMQTYASVKTNFFNQKNAKSCVVNVDDDYGKNILSSTDLPAISYGIKNPSEIFAINIKMNLDGSSYVVNMLDYIFNVKTKLCALFNVYNVLGAIGVLKMIGFEENQIELACKNINVVGGRFNLIKLGQKFNIIVDYAHTPEGLKSLLQETRNLTKKSNICVFGCPGNRDELKRSIMGEIAGNNCEFVVLTSDNPQYENSFRIIKEVEKGIKKTNCQYIIVEDRKLAIKCALSVLKNDCNLLIVGKGAENYQNINGFKIPYNDSLAVKECVIEFLEGNKKEKATK